jgi:hypothetical protein
VPTRRNLGISAPRITEQQIFTATVNDVNPAVSWLVNGGVAGLTIVTTAPPCVAGDMFTTADAACWGLATETAVTATAPASGTCNGAV